MNNPLFRRIRRHAETRLKLAPERNREQVFRSLETFLRLENQMLLRSHRKGRCGLQVSLARACVADVMVESLFKYAIRRWRKINGPAPSPLCVVALGGYGRAELSPFSDIDLMFLYPDGIEDPRLPLLQKAVSETILYVLWDLKLKIGHSTRTVGQTLEEARKNIKSKNAMLEARLVTGRKKLYHQFSRNYKKYYREDRPEEYIKARLDDQEARRQQYGGTVFLQEPDIKNGVGGLRDYQNILWMAQIKLGIDSLEKLCRRKFLSKEAYRKLTGGYDFLHRVRNELHFQSNRPSDLLDLEKQPLVAEGLGYRQENLFKRVEAFMKDYYHHAGNISRLSRILEKKLSFPLPPPALKNRSEEAGPPIRKLKFDGFFLHQNTLSSGRRTIFQEDPERLLRIFRHSQEFRAEPNFDLRNLIAESLPLLTGKVFRSPTANRCFRAILQTAGNVYPTLNRMHELGVLERFLPEFSGLTCLVQHEFYHRYTADIHTLNAIRELDEIFTGESPYANSYHFEIHETANPTLLYLILLLHDIGKGAAISGHSQKGAKMAETVLDRLGVSPELKNRVFFVIRNHLEMARFWQRFDVEDPASGRAFAKLVGDRDILRYLFVHTFCDARATASTLWNSYKNMLHTRLFHNTLACLEERALQPSRRARKTRVPPSALKARLPRVPEEEIEAHYKRLPESYFIDNGVEEIAYHIGRVNAFLHHFKAAESLRTLVPVVDWKDDLSLSMTVVNIVTWDRPGLFFRLAGAFSVAGLNILRIKALSRSDHITIDTFYVCEPGGGPARKKAARKIFQANLEKTLLHGEDLLPAIMKAAGKVEKPAYLLRAEKLKAPIPPKVEIIRADSLSQIILEVQTLDRIGILYRLAKAIYDHGFDIAFARISTEQGVVVDTFHLEFIDRTRENFEPDLLALEKTLRRLVA